MRRRRSVALPILAVLTLGSAAARADITEGALQPYQMVRSLQLVQDRIAGGDHAALPMQKKLLELTDARFRAASNEDFADRRNAQALMVYAMSGGNPATVADSLARRDMNEDDRAAGAGILGYLTGDVAQARSALATIDPGLQPQEVAAFLYLVKGSVLAGDDPATALPLLDRARLLAPGTLVEEAALRRTVSLAVTTGDGERFMSAAEQYARRYLRSPYASQFAEGFVSGVVGLKDSLDLIRIEQTVAWMTREQARVVYLRLARRAAIDGDATLLEFASSRARNYPPSGAGEGEEDTRGQLYSSLSSVTSETVEDVLTRLRQLDARQLTEGDRALLDAAKAVAAEVMAPVNQLVVPASMERAGAPAQNGEQAAAETQATSDLVLSARKKLEAIDKMLQETEQ